MKVHLNYDVVKQVDTSNVYLPDYKKLFVKLNDKQLFSVRVKKNDQVSNVANMIKSKFDLQGSDLRLINQGSYLNNSCTIEECELEEGSNVQVMHGLRGGMQIFVKNIEGKIYTLEVSPQDRVEDIKNKIYEKSGFPPNDQRLVFKNVSLTDDQVINGVGIKSNSEINLVIRRSNGIKVYCRVKDSSDIETFVHLTDRVSELKKHVCEFTGAAVKDTELIFGKRILDDRSTIEECGIVEESDIDVIAKKNTNFVIYVAVLLLVVLLVYELIVMWQK